ncbi:hypothetical protein ACIRPK_23865 [Kitasatospora sp. NPDC101801]|uniref:hypothetical protein n=1 Tax=Kitasatospora sp. NPDC101801 TaxID=3364103 RepID=UPI00381C4F50
MPLTCASYGYTNRPGGCGRIAAAHITITYAKRRTTRWPMCTTHAARVHEDLADPLFAYLRHTSVIETPIEADHVNPTESECR